MGNPQITLVTLVDVFIMVAWGISNHSDSFDIINDRLLSKVQVS